MVQGKRFLVRRVLIVEDDTDALGVLRAWLETQGCTVRSARTGRLALEIGATFDPEVLITDYSLEGDLTGVDVIAELRNRAAKVRCVLVTGVLQNAMLESVKRIDRVPILTKPFDFSRLAELLSAG
jgi:two-component system, cell cycle sensor histidine kinase and response regulator CckA